jgi:hypothetical protein
VAGRLPLRRSVLTWCSSSGIEYFSIEFFGVWWLSIIFAFRQAAAAVFVACGFRDAQYRFRRHGRGRTRSSSQPAPQRSMQHQVWGSPMRASQVLLSRLTSTVPFRPSREVFFEHGGRHGCQMPLHLWLRIRPMLEVFWHESALAMMCSRQDQLEQQ